MRSVSSLILPKIPGQIGQPSNLPAPKASCVVSDERIFAFVSRDSASGQFGFGWHAIEWIRNNAYSTSRRKLP